VKLRWALLLAIAMLTAACAGILGIRPREQRLFEHRAHALAGVNCVRCHEGVASAGEVGALHVPGADTCRSCHQKPHDERECSSCHGRPDVRAAASRARETLRFEHKTHGPRVRGDCVRCHLDIERDLAVLRPRMANCGSCHEHREALAKRDCDACHVDLKNEGTMPEDHLAHDGNFLRRHGPLAAADVSLCQSCHTERSCSACHGRTAPILPERLAFDDPRRAGVHRAGFASRHAEEARGDPGLCTTCHSPRTCAGCHQEKSVAATGGGRRSFHPPGWLGLPGQPNDHGRASWRDPALCASCHGGAGEALCVGCHRVGGIGGNPHARGFTSRMRKTERPCNLCHVGGR
jgi:hypothetical protein